MSMFILFPILAITRSSLTFSIKESISHCVTEENLSHTLQSFVTRHQLGDALEHKVGKSELNPTEVNSRLDGLQEELLGKVSIEELQKARTTLTQCPTKEEFQTLANQLAVEQQNVLSGLLDEQAKIQITCESAVSKTTTMIEEVCLF